MSVTSPTWFFLKENQMTQTPIAADLLATRAKKVPLYKAFVLPTVWTGNPIESLLLDIPYRSKGAVEVRDIAKQCGAFFDGKEWQITRSKIEGAAGQERVDALNALRVIRGAKLIDIQRISRTTGYPIIYLKVPYDQRGIASADGAHWCAITRRWMFNVILNDAAFSAKISTWEERGQVDADFTELQFVSKCDIFTAKTLRPTAPCTTGFIVNAWTTDVHRTCFIDQLNEMNRSIGSALPACSPFSCGVLHSVSPSGAFGYSLQCYFVNEPYTTMTQAFENNPVVFVLSRTEDLITKKTWKTAYFVRSSLMREYWNKAVKSGFTSKGITDIGNEYVQDMITISSQEGCIKAFGSSTEFSEDPVFHRMSESYMNG